MNLLRETRDDIATSGHAVDQIVFIGSERSGHSCTWDEFEKLADQEYDDDYGAQKVATDLIIVFSDGTTMWRHEYDGSENWAYSSPFVMPTETKPIERLFTRTIGWDDLATINEGSER